LSGEDVAVTGEGIPEWASILEDWGVELETQLPRKYQVKVESSDAISIMAQLKEAGFDHMSAISAVDWYDADADGGGEFELVYHLWGYGLKDSLSVKTRVPRDGGSIDTLMNVYEYAQTYEREIHEMFGIDFPGNDRLTPFILEDWTEMPPMRKDFDYMGFIERSYTEAEEGEFEVTPEMQARIDDFADPQGDVHHQENTSREYEWYFGPQHPGMHGNFSIKFTMEGNIIRKAIAIPGFLHRAFEKLLETKLWMQNVSLVPRICVPDPEPNEVAYATAIERIMGVEVPRRARLIRTMVLEMSRIGSHIFTLGATAGSMGLYTFMYWGVSLRDLLLDIFELLTGARVYHIYVYPGGVRQDLPDGFLRKLEKFLDQVDADSPDYYNIFFTNHVVKRRLVGMAPLSREEIKRFGVVGPNMRASGIKQDLRKDDPYAAYDEVEFDVPTGENGDGWDRIMVRWQELGESVKIIRQVIELLKEEDGETMAKVPKPLAFKVPPGDSYCKVESSKGEYGYYIVSDGGKKPHRAHVRGPSFNHGIQLLEHILVGQQVADVPTIISTLDVCSPDIDR